MQFEHDHDDPPPTEDGWMDMFYYIFNRYAEQCAAIARAWGFLP